MIIDNKFIASLFPDNFMELNEEEKEKLDEKAKKMLEENDWVEVYKKFDYYLRNNCNTEDSVINYIYLFVRYVGLDFDIPYPFDSYDLVGFIYSKVDLEKRWGDCGDLFDDFANEALKVDLMKDPYYQFWRDPKILEISGKYGKK